MTQFFSRFKKLNIQETIKIVKRSGAVVMTVFLAVAMAPDPAWAKRMGGGTSVGRQHSGLMNKRVDSPPSSVPGKPAGAQNAAGQQGSNLQQQSAGGPATNTSAATQGQATAAKSSQQTATSAPATQQPARNRWLGPLAGLAAGFGLAALFSHFGMGGALASMISTLLIIGLLAVAVMFIVRMFRNNKSSGAGQVSQSPAYAASYQGAAVENAAQNTTPNAVVSSPKADHMQANGKNNTHFEGVNPFGQSFDRAQQPCSLGAELNAFGQPIAALDPVPSAAPVSVKLSESTSAPQSPNLLNIPVGFDTQGFTNAAQRVFVRLQGAYNTGDLTVLREFLSDDLFNRFSTEIVNRGHMVEQTVFFDLQTQLMAYDQTPSEHLASVLFTGQVQQSADLEAVPFEEVWNLNRPTNNQGGWVLMGIQAV